MEIPPEFTDCLARQREAYLEDPYPDLQSRRADLEALHRMLRENEAEIVAAIRRYRRPQPRLAVRQVLLDHARAAMDLSDGLAKDLGRMCRASGCGAQVYIEQVPREAAARAAIAFDRSRWSDVVAAGDDYELLVAVAPEKADAFDAAANQAGRCAREPFAVTRIGDLTASDAIRFLDSDGKSLQLERSGWDHF